MDSKEILIAEDNLDNYLLLKAILKKHPFVITYVKNGKEALDKIMNQEFDLLLIDIQMPIMSGYVLVETIRKQGITTPAIAQTAFAFSTDKIKCLEIGFNDYISKPINKELLLEKMNNLL